MQPTIRVATPSDAAAIARLTAELGYPLDEGAAAQRIAELGAMEREQLLVAEADGAVVAWIHGAMRVSVTAPPTVEIVGLVVEQERRGEGIGSHLVRAIEAWAMERGAERLRVRSQVKRVESHAFYLRRGYEETKRQACFEKRLSKEGVDEGEPEQS